MNILRVTVYRTPVGADGPPWCWQIDGASTSGQHGQADSPNACLCAAYASEASRLTQWADDAERDAAARRAVAARLLAMMPTDTFDDAIPL
jgi:hypothetical protein